jgi:hypothetical protein
MKIIYNSSGNKERGYAMRKLQFIILLLGSYSLCSGQDNGVNLPRDKQTEELVGLFKELSKQLDADQKEANCITQQDQEARTLAEFFELAKNDPRLAASLIGESIYEAISSHPKTSSALALGIPAIIALLLYLKNQDPKNWGEFDREFYRQMRLLSLMNSLKALLGIGSKPVV